MTYTLEIKLNSLGLDDYLEKRFKYGYKLKRAVENWFNTQEHRRITSQGYKELTERMKQQSELQKEISETKDKALKLQLKGEFKERSEELKKDWIELNNSFLLNSSKFVDYKNLGQASAMYNQYSSEGIINWSTFENIAATVKAAYLKRRKQSESDNRLTITKYRDFNTLWYRKCNQNITMDGVWFGPRGKKILIPYAFRKGDDIKLSYAMERQKLAWYGLKRVVLKNGRYKYSVLLVFDGAPYGVETEFLQTGEVNIWVDINSLSIKAQNLSNGQLVEFDISNDYGYAAKLSELDRKIERSRRLSNPQNYEENGTIKPGRSKWVFSKNYYRLLNQKRYLWHKIKKSRKNRFGEIINTILDLGDTFIISKKDFKSLQSRKDYNPEEMSWFDTRRQHGFEIMFNAPYEFVELLKIKLQYRDSTPSIVVEK